MRWLVYGIFPFYYILSSISLIFVYQLNFLRFMGLKLCEIKPIVKTLEYYYRESNAGAFVSKILITCEKILGLCLTGL